MWKVKANYPTTPQLLTVVSPRDIEKFLKGYGRIRNISVKEGFGFAEFDDRRDADDAVKVNNIV